MSKKVKIFLLGLFIILVIILFPAKVNASTPYDNPAFDGEFYLNNYSDLKSAFGVDYKSAYNHFITFGIREGRQASLCFDVKYYLNYYEDLSKAYQGNYAEAYNHFMTFGIKEGRKSSPYFDVKYYLNYYGDLSKAYQGNYAEAYNHFMTFGIKEGRRGSEYFDIKYYLDNNSDLKKTFQTNYKSAYEHYLTFGIKEGRNPSEKVNIKCYLNSYLDLQKAFAKNYKNVAEHYYLFGEKEGRKATHTIIEVRGKKATCTEKGLTAGKKCKTCGEVIEKSKELPKINHDYKVVETKDATCEQDGYTKYQCTMCKAVKQEKISAKGHNWGEPTYSWTDTSSAKATFTCKNDGSHKKEVDGKIVKTKDTAECEKAGEAEYTATFTLNGKTYTDVKTVESPALQHEWSDFKDGGKNKPYYKECSKCKKKDEKKVSEFTIESLDEEDKNEDDLFENGWDEQEGYETKFESQNNYTVKLTGLITIFDESEFTGEDIPFDKDGKGYYLGFKLKINDSSINTSGNSSIIVKFVHNNENDNVITKNDFGENNEIFVLKYIDPNDTKKTFDVTVDLDGESSKEYAPYTLTVDWSELKLQVESEPNVSLNSASKEDKDTFSQWGYTKPDEQEITLENGKLKGKLVEQKLISQNAFGEGNEDGFYFDFTFKAPKGVDKSKIKISNIKDIEQDESDSNVIKTFKPDEFDNENNLTILKRFDANTTNCTKCSDECKNGTSDCTCDRKLYFKVDWDGDGNEYLPTYYTLNYCGVIFEKSSMFTVSGINEDKKTKFDDYGWLEKEGYYTKFEEESPSRYKVTGVLPIFYDNEWESQHDPLQSSENDYYLGLLLKLVKAPDSYSENTNKITVKFLDSEGDDKNFQTVTGNDFDTSKELYILKYLVPSEKTKEFEITVDLDGKSEEYAPYTVTIDYSDLVFQSNSLDDVDFNIIKSKDLENNSKEKQELEDYGYKFETGEKLEIKINNEQEDREPYKEGIKGSVKQQTLNSEAGFKNNEGYFVPIKISMPNEDYLSDYKNSWTLILHDEEGNEKVYIPTPDEYSQGWVLVLFKLNESQKEIKYSIDFDGTFNEEQHTGADFLPCEYTIKYDELQFQTENKVTFEYFDEAEGKIVKEDEIIYQGEGIDPLIAPQLTEKNYSYHKFDYWYNVSDNSEVPFILGDNNYTTNKNEDIILKAHWTIDVDTFLADVVKDLADEESEITEDYSNIFEISKVEDVITFKVLDSTTKLSEMNNTSIPGTIAFILQRGEIKDITLSYGGKKIVFTKDGTNNEVQSISLDLEGTTLKEKIQTGAKALFTDVLGGDDKEQDMTLNKMAVLGNTFALEVGNLDNSVKLSDETKLKYTFKFETEIATVSNETELESALKNSAVKCIDIVNDFEVTHTHDVTTNNLVIKSSNEDNKTLTANGTDINTIFDVKGNNINIKDIKLKGKAKTAITVESSASVISEKIDFTGIAEGKEEGAGIEVKSNGSFTGNGFIYNDEKYMKPLLRAENGTTVNVNVSESLLKPTNVEEIKKYNGSKTEFDATIIGDEKQEKANYNYKHYYLDSNVANRWIRVAYSANRAITYIPLSYIIYHDKESGKQFLDEPEDIKYINYYETNNTNYTLSQWNGNNKVYSKGQIPVSDISKNEVSFSSGYTATYKDHVQVVANEEELKQALDKSEIKTIVVNGEIELKNKLVISKSELIITGSSSGTTEIKGTLKGIIEITGNKVIFDHIKIVGSNNVVEENSHVITIKGTEFDSNQVQYNIESGNFDSILYYDVTDPDSALFYNTFNGDNNTSTYVKFNQEVDGNEEIDSSVKSNGTSITGNKIVDSENNAITFLEMKKVKENTVLNIRQIDQAFNNNNSKLLKLDAEPSNSNVTVNLSSIWTSAGSQKNIKIEVDNSQQEDASGITIVRKNVSPELMVSYTKSEPTEEHKVKIIEK